MSGPKASRRGTRGPRFDAESVRRWVRESATEMSAHRDLLTQLDAAIGDADHGINMERGFTAAAAAMETANGATPGEILLETASTLMFRVGGAAGPLYGSGFREAGNSLGKAASFGPQDLVDALRAALAGIQAVGAAVEGDKTMVDAWAPAVEALGREISAGDDIVEALGRAREAAEAGAQATVPLQARKGRASYLGPRSVGHRDPGASSTSLLFAALERALREA